MNRYWKRMMKYRPGLYMELLNRTQRLNYSEQMANSSGQNRRNSRGASVKKGI
jgi:hypothetical protein